MSKDDLTTEDEQTPVHRLVRWVVSEVRDGKPIEWQLMVAVPGRETIPAASVRRNDWNRATWHTWSQSGEGGENWVEDGMTSDIACQRAKAEAAGAAIEQGFI